ncbi:MAG: LamG domain-containing protein [Deltaproteobacteria bacterium]|nr:LamG domain-containing protein [Deltaproteobacteria bacterium]
MALQDGLVSVWHMNNDWLDSYGNNDGTSTGAIFDPTIKKLGTHSGQFDGVDDRIAIPDDPGLSFGDGTNDSSFSISLWIRHDGTILNNMGLVSQDSPAGIRGWGLSLIHISGKHYPYFALYDNSPTNRIVRRSIGTEVPIDTWCHLVATYDGSSLSSGMKIYLDTSRVDDDHDNSGTYAAMHDLSVDFSIGYAVTGSYYFKGNIDEVNVWNRELSSVEVAELWNIGAGIELTVDSNILIGKVVSAWSMNEISGSNVSDSFGTNNGIVTGTTINSTDPKTGIACRFFDGINDDITITGYKGILGTNPRAFSAFVRSSDTKIQRIFAYGADVSAGLMTLNAENNKLSVRIYNGNIIYNAPGLNDGNWHHVGLSLPRNATLNDVQIYLDGQVLTSVSSSSNPTTTINTQSGQDFKIGLHDTDLPSRWHGDIDATHWFNDELSSAEFAFLYSNGAGIEINELPNDFTVINLRRSGY